MSGYPHGVVTIGELQREIERQDAKHGRLTGARIGLAVLQDEVDEALAAWRDERRDAEWSTMHVELLQVAAVALRAIRDTTPKQERL